MRPFTLLIIPLTLLAQRGGNNANNGAPLAPLYTVRPPAPTGVDPWVRDSQALRILGKAFFWDMQVGSDGRTACATCHFHAGADHRSQNILIGGTVQPNQIATIEQFPFRTANRIAGSPGVVAARFDGVTVGQSFENPIALTHGTAASINGIGTRQITTRNSPSVINAAFNYRNF
jgi:cytochrome c peroxidase